MATLRYGFHFDRRFAPALALLGVTSSHAYAEVDGSILRVRFGLWSLVTPLANVARVQRSGPYGALKVIGPRLSLADRGITFGTNARSGVCVEFHRPVPGIDPLGLIRHPNLTMTVADPDGLAAALSRRAA